MSYAIKCPSCGNEAKPAGDNWGVWRCDNRDCNRYARPFIPKVMSTPFIRKKNRFARKKA